MPNRRLAAIIPYFQRTPEILTSALTSILNQDLPPGTSVHAFIIDDSSPHPAEDELKTLEPGNGVTWSVHPQENAGPGGARNRGLSLVEEGVFDFVAFLDSDDTWQPRHLREALEALDQGYGFYFCDNTRDGAHDSYNESLSALRDHGKAIRDKAVELSADGPVLGFPPGALASEMVAEYLCQTSCIVARADALEDRRFDLEQRVAGEDHLFWIDIFLSGPAIVISWKRNVDCGTGVNIFFSAFDWNDPRTLERLGDLLLFAEKLKARPDLEAQCGIGITDQLVQQVRRYRFAYSYLFLRTLMKGHLPSARSLRKLTRKDPWLPARMPFLAARAAVDRRIDRRC